MRDIESNDDTPASNVARFELQELLAEIFENTRLSEKDMRFLNLRFTQDLSQTEIAEAFGLTRQRIQQMEHEILRRLKFTLARMTVEEGSMSLADIVKIARVPTQPKRIRPPAHRQHTAERPTMRSLRC
jgi:DNA-directed RNA polymerase sigma subunit (sigma70/sigma32)